MLAVGGLSAITATLFLWAMCVAGLSGAEGGPAIFEVGVFAGANLAAVCLLWWHRRYPARVFAGILAVYVVSALLTGVSGNGGLTLPLWFSVFALTAYAPLLQACIAIAIGWIVCAAIKVYLAVASGLTVTTLELGLVFAVDVGFFYLACAVLGLAFRAQHRRASEAAERARLIEERARAVEAEAVATERNRLARDLHDLAAHELMDVLLSIRALQIDNEDPILPEIEQKTARALDNMRAVVRTLRADGAVPGSERLPLQEAAAQVIDALSAERGIDVISDIRVTEPVDDASASTVLSVLTETVLNAGRHMPGAPVTVTLDTDASHVRLTVTNPTSRSRGQEPQGTGYGLVGAAERAKLLGGTFDARRHANGDWVATLRLPTSTAPAEHELEEIR